MNYCWTEPFAELSAGTTFMHNGNKVLKIANNYVIDYSFSHVYNAFDLDECELIFILPGTSIKCDEFGIRETVYEYDYGYEYEPAYDEFSFDAQEQQENTARRY